MYKNCMQLGHLLKINKYCEAGTGFFFGKYLFQHKNDRWIADDLWADSFGLAARDAAASHDIWADRGQGRDDRSL